MSTTGRRARNIVLISAAILIALLVVLRASPVLNMIGRSNPVLAARLSPPFFNYSAAFTTGNVVEFAVGMDRQQLVQILHNRDHQTVVLRGNCGSNVKYFVPDVAIISDEGTKMLMERDLLCLWQSARHLNTTVILQGNQVTQIKVSVTFSELL